MVNISYQLLASLRQTCVTACVGSSRIMLIDMRSHPKHWSLCFMIWCHRLNNKLNEMLAEHHCSSLSASWLWTQNDQLLQIPAAMLLCDVPGETCTKVCTSRSSTYQTDQRNDLTQVFLSEPSCLWGDYRRMVIGYLQGHGDLSHSCIAEGFNSGKLYPWIFPNDLQTDQQLSLLSRTMIYKRRKGWNF